MRIHPIFSQNLMTTKTDKICFVKNTSFISPSINRDSFEKTATQETPQSVHFKGFRCSTENFKPRNLYDMPCASCGEKTLLDLQIKCFAKDVDNKTGQDLIAALLRRKEYFRKTEGEVVDILIKSAQKNSESNLEDLVKISKENYKKDLERIQLEILEEIKAKSDKLEFEDAELLCNYINNAEKLIANSSDESYFQRKVFVYGLEKLGKEFKKQDEFKNILEYAKKLPTSSDSVSAFFVKYSRRTSEKIAERLLAPSVATTEHILPRSDGGENNTENYMVMCGDCNSKRSSMSYSKWMKIKPEMPQSFSKYINEVITRLKTGELDSVYSTYPYEACKTMKEQTNGVISVIVPEEIARVKEKREIPVKTISVEERYVKAKKSYETREQTLEQLQRKKTELESDPQYQMLVRYFALQKTIDDLTAARKKASDDISAAKRKQETLRKKETTIGELRTSLEDSSLSTKKKNEINSKIKSLEKKAGKAQDYDEEIETLRNRYDSVSENLKRNNHEKFTLLATLHLPETLTEKQRELKARLDEIMRVEYDIERCEKAKKEETSLLAKKEALEETISQAQASFDTLYSGVDLNSNTNSALIGEYQILCSKLQLAQSIDPKSFVKILQAQKGIQPNFLQDEAILSLEGKIAKMDSEEAIKCFKSKAEIEKLKRELAGMQSDLAKKSGISSELSALQKKLEQLQSSESTQNLEAQLRALENERLSIQDKINNMDIDSRIASASNSLAEARSAYVDLLRLNSVAASFV